MSKSSSPSAGRPAAAALAPLVRRHLVVGWWSILIFLSVGVVLEALHGFKVPWYLNVANETRRLMMTLGHAHGVLLGLLHVAFAATVRLIDPDGAAVGAFGKASLCLSAATVLLPGGFLLGGLVIYGGDPGRGILLVPVGAVLLFVAVALTGARASRR